METEQQTILYRRWAPMKRLQAACELYRFAREVIKTREKRLNPRLSEKELERRVRSFFL